MKGKRIPGGYKGGKAIEKKVFEKKKYLEKVLDNEKVKFGNNSLYLLKTVVEI